MTCSEMRRASVLFAGLVLACVRSQVPDTTVVHNVRLFDGDQIIEQATVVWKGDRVVAAGRDVVVPAGASVVEGSGKTLLPGLIDGHAHVWETDQLEQSAVFGVTTVLDHGCGDAETRAELKVEADKPASTLSDLRFAGHAVTVPGAHCTEYGPSPTLSRADEVSAFVADRVREGSQYIKLIFDDLKVVRPARPTMTADILTAAIKAAHAHGKLAIVHIGSLDGARQAVLAGADGLAHAFLDQEPNPEFVQAMATHHAFLEPTLGVNRSLVGVSPGRTLLSDPDLAPYLGLESCLALKRSFSALGNARYDIAKATVRQLNAVNVPILAGTDAPNPGVTHGASLHGEIELLVEAGLSPLAALKAATSVPADQFHLTDRGRVVPGKRADLLLVVGNPTQDVRATRKIEAVWVHGAAVDRARFLSAVQAERTRTERRPPAPIPPHSEAGLISDFEDLAMTTKFGIGWSQTTDAVRGGKSTVRLEPIPAGADGSRGALRVSGQIVQGVPWAWAGAMFSPGLNPMAPANLADKRELRFAARGDGNMVRVLLLRWNRAYSPGVRVFVAGPEWKTFTFPFADFDETDGHDLTAIAFVGGPFAGPFEFEIDNVELR